MKLLLTDRFCQTAKSATPQTDYFDVTVRGLALRVTSKGTKAWTFHYTSGNKRVRKTLGRYPAVSLAGARTLASEATSAVAEGRDPRISAGTMTVAALAERYIAHVANLRSAKEIERRIRKDILPVIGNVPLSDLHRRDATRIIDGKADAPIAARRAFEDLRAMLRWAVSRGDLDHNPVEGMQGPDPSKPRERVLSDDEIRTLWLALPKALSRSLACQQIIKLCLVTGQRLGEVVGMRRGELDLKRAIWQLPGSRTKNGYAHTVPLSGSALEIINEALGPSDAMFPTIGGARVVANTIKFGQGRIGIPQWTAHDLRRTALTRMAELGVAPIVLGHVANHRTTTKAGMTLSVYVHHAYEKEKREALELWADRLRGIVAGGADVIALGRER
jgi:integrase